MIPLPFRQARPAEPERESVAFASAFYLRSPLRAFLDMSAHADARRLTPDMRRDSVFRLWKARGDELPLGWDPIV